MSEHKSLAEALLAFQSEAPTVPKTATNPHFKSKFVPLDTLVQTIQPLLTKHGLTWTTMPCYGPDGAPALQYRLAHAVSGEAIADTMPLLLGKQDSQGLGSALTYSRRYALSAVLNLVADEDDDGNKAAAAQAGRAPATNGAAPRKLNEDERSRVLAAINESGGQPDLVWAAVGVSSPTELTVDHATQIRALLNKKLVA